MARRVIVPVVVFLLSFAAVAGMSGSMAPALVDIPSFLMVPVLPFLYTAGCYGFKGVRRAYRAAWAAETVPDDLGFAGAFFKDLGKNLWLFCAVAFGAGLIAFFGNLGRPETLGPSLAVAILVILYGGLFHLLLISPFQMNVNRRLALAGRTGGISPEEE